MKQLLTCMWRNIRLADGIDNYRKRDTGHRLRTCLINTGSRIF